jgi:hypothetical protein
MDMKDRDIIDINLEGAFRYVSEWKGSGKGMWERIYIRTSQNRRENILGKVRIAAISTAIAAVFMFLIVNVGFPKSLLKDRYYSKSNHTYTGNTGSTEEVSPESEGNNAEKENPEPDKSNPEAVESRQLNPSETLDNNGHHSIATLGWLYNLNDTDKTFAPGQEVTLSISFNNTGEDIIILEEEVNIILAQLPTMYHLNEVKMAFAELKNKLLKGGEEYNFTVNFRAPKDPGEYNVGIGDIMVRCGNTKRLGYLGSTSFYVTGQDNEDSGDSKNNEDEGIQLDLDPSETLDINGHHGLSTLGWYYDLDPVGNTFKPGQEVTLTVSFNNVGEDVKILEENPHIFIGKLPRMYYLNEINILLPELKNKILKGKDQFHFTVKFKAPEEPGEYLITIGDIKVQVGNITRLAYAGGAEFKVEGTDKMKDLPDSKELTAQEAGYKEH